jgi:hypothetical protein
MTARKKITTKAGKVLSILLMSFCLVFLTGVNFFVYADNEKAIACTAVDERQQDENKAPNPTEEKSSSSNSPTVQEEYLHEKHSSRELARLDKLIHDRIMEAEKLQIVHYELLLPPPKA